jgi:endonuclease V-like protein UPF0215 family
MNEVTNLKAEIRVVGIDDGDSRQRRRIVIGVVFRGGLWLDGVIGSVLDVSTPSLGKKLGVMVAESKFYKELRFAILHGGILGSALPVLTEFREVTDLPTIALLSRRQRGRVDSTLKEVKNAVKFSVQPELTAFCTDLTTQKAREILKITTARGPLPEPVRVARLIASAANSPKRLN